MPVVKLTESFIKNNLLFSVYKHKIEYCDQELPGLYLEVRATSQGEGTYYLRYKDASGPVTKYHLDDLKKGRGNPWFVKIETY